MTSSGPAAQVAARPSDLAALSEVRELLAVSESRAQVITNDRSLGFPEPWYVTPSGRARVWLKADVGDWVGRKRPELAARVDELWPGWRDGPRTSTFSAG